MIEEDCNYWKRLSLLKKIVIIEKDCNVEKVCDHWKELGLKNPCL